METNCVIHWIEIYPVDSAIQLLNNWGQGSKECHPVNWEKWILKSGKLSFLLTRGGEITPKTSQKDFILRPDILFHTNCQWVCTRIQLLKSPDYCMHDVIHTYLYSTLLKY